MRSLAQSLDYLYDDSNQPLVVTFAKEILDMYHENKILREENAYLKSQLNQEYQHNIRQFKDSTKMVGDIFMGLLTVATKDAIER